VLTFVVALTSCLEVLHRLPLIASVRSVLNCFFSSLASTIRQSVCKLVTLSSPTAICISFVFNTTASGKRPLSLFSSYRYRTLPHYTHPLCRPRSLLRPEIRPGPGRSSLFTGSRVTDHWSQMTATDHSTLVFPSPLWPSRLTSCSPFALDGIHLPLSDCPPCA